MRISSFTVYGSSNGNLIVDISGGHLCLELSDNEADRLRQVAQKIVEERQTAMAAAVSQPFAALADYSEF